MIIKNTIAILLTVILCHGITLQENTIKKTAWLIGTWECKTPRGNTYEQWTQQSQNKLVGKSYMIKGTDTIVFEHINIIYERDSLFYVPIVKNQNKGLPVRFTLKSITDTSFVFENPRHDFPQFISYTRVAPDSLVAKISGKKNNQERSVQFPMKKLK